MATHDDHDADDLRGLSELARSILDHGADYAEARIELARLESEEAVDHLRGTGLRLGIGSFAASAGYAIVVVSFLALIGRKFFGGSWELAAIVIGALHLVVGALFFMLAGAMPTGDDA